MKTNLFRHIFGPTKGIIIGMIHIWDGPRIQQIEQALQDLERLRYNVDGVIVENYGWGYGRGSNSATPEAIMRVYDVTQRVVELAGRTFPVGINLLPNDYEHAIGLCALTGARFIQLDHVTGNFCHATSVDPNQLAKARRIDPSIAILGGIHPKYYTLKDPATRIEDSARTAMELCDAIVLTGDATGRPVSHDDLRVVRQTIGAFPLLIGSGLTPDLAIPQLMLADGAIVGTAFKRGGVRHGEQIDAEMVQQLMSRVRRFRATDPVPMR